MREYDIRDGIAITRDIIWVGFPEAGSRLVCNPYLLVDAEEAVLFDPGSIPDFPVVMRKIVDIVNPSAISTLVLSHQDPDVCGNLAVVEDVIERADLRIVAHLNTIRLVQHQAPRSAFYSIEEHDSRLTLRSGRVLEFLHVPFLHSPGAIVTYDRQTKSLFSGDLFGAIDGTWTPFVGDGFPGNMKAFHQAYMPSNALLRAGLERLEALDIERILPQHGSVIEGEQVRVAIDYLKALPCGADLTGAGGPG